MLANESKATRNQTNRATVTFCPTARVRRTISLDDFTEDEIRACWYSEVEIFNSRAEIQQTIALVSRNIELDDVHHCRRGLETATGNTKKVKMQRRRTAVDIVLSYQEAAEEDVVEEEYYKEKAAQEYSSYCKSSHIMAFMVGIADANEVRMYSSENLQRTNCTFSNRKEQMTGRAVERRQAMVLLSSCKKCRKSRCTLTSTSRQWWDGSHEEEDNWPSNRYYCVSSQATVDGNECDFDFLAWDDRMGKQKFRMFVFVFNAEIHALHLGTMTTIVQ